MKRQDGVRPDGVRPDGVRPDGVRHGVRLPWLAVFGLAFLLLAPALPALELSCEKGENEEGGCCCFLGAHTYRFQPTPVSRIQVTFDTGRGVGCSSQVAIQVLQGGEWRTAQTANAVSSSGRSEMNRLSGTLAIGDTISGVRLDDGGRCYIDYSQVVIEPSGTPQQEAGTAAAAGLVSGTYRVEAYSDRAHESTWQLEIAGGRITGTSEWDCCPGRRTDPLDGSVRGNEVQVARSCTGQGTSGRCVQVFDGKIGEDRIEGTWTHNDKFAGWWNLDLARPVRQEAVPPPAGDKPAQRIVASPAPPYAETPVTIEFVAEPGPVPGGVWWMDGRRMTNAELFFWTFGDREAHEVDLRRDGERLASLTVDLARPAVRKIKIVPDRPAPYVAPVQVSFRQDPQPVTGARWFLNGRPISDAQSFSWRFGETGNYRVTLQSARGDVLAEYVVWVTER